MSTFLQRKIQRYTRKKQERGVKKNAYSSLETSKDFHLISRACCHFAKAVLGKEKLITAFIGSSALSRMESLQDCGFYLENPKESFFGLENDPGMFQLTRPMHTFPSNKFDVALLLETDLAKKRDLKHILSQQKNCLAFDIEEMADLFRRALNSIKAENFHSCLNVYKLAIIFICTYLCPTKRQIAEIGAYKCGTTLFMAKILQQMGKECQIYAFDTFSGMPRASENDKKGLFCFDVGMFCDNDLKKVKQCLEKEKVLKHIILCPGLAQETVPKVLSKKEDLFFAFIDTDQYLGTFSGLNQVLNSMKGEDFLIVVDDPIVAGVDNAIEEILKNWKNVIRKRVFTNFELLFSKNFSTQTIFS